MECIYNVDEFCTNDQCPMRADYCPVPDVEGVCKYEKREEVRYILTPKGCLAAAMLNAGIDIGDADFDDLWNDFEKTMKSLGYIHEEEN